MVDCSIVRNRNFFIKVKSIDYPAVEPPLRKTKTKKTFFFNETVVLFSVFEFQSWQYSYEMISVQPL